jgi:hypothetical protein
MRSDGMREFSKSQLVKTTRYAVLQKMAATQASARLLRRWWATLAVATALSFAAGVVLAWVVLR